MSIMNFMQLLIVTSAALTALARFPPSQLQTRAFTGPPCNASFQWTDNEQNVSPCDLAAAVIGSCEGPTWNIPSLQAGNQYDPPAGVNVTQCSCSWAAYNLLMACTVCQGDEESVFTWPAYSTNCMGGNLSNKYFPDTQALPDGTGIPFYAAQNPATTWPDQRFDLQQALDLHNQGHHDLVQSSPHDSSSPVGAIVGGVIGGLAVLTLAGGLFFCLYRRRQRRVQSSGTGTNGSQHSRNLSDLSQKSGIGFGYQQLERSFATSPTSQPPLSPTTGTMHTHSASVNSLSYFGSVRHSVNPYGTSTSPPPGTQTISSVLSPSYPPNTQGPDREGIIVPFTLPPSDMTSLQGSSTNLSDRKRADGAIIPVYDSPNALPHNAAPAFSEISSTTTRARFNPPAYSDVDNVSVVTPTHQKKDSNDTQFSTDSKTGSVVQKRSGTGGGSISAIEEVIGQIGLAGHESVSAGGTLSTGQSGQLPGARPFRPVLGNPDP